MTDRETLLRRLLRRLPLLGLALLLLAGCATEPIPAPTLAPTPAPTLAPTVIVPSGTATPSVLPPLEDVPVVARVNDVEITSVAFGRELLRTAKLLQEQQGIDWYSEKGQAGVPALRESVLNQLIEQELLRQLAKAEGITVSEARVRALASAASKELVKQLDYDSWDDFLKAFQISNEEFLETFRLQLMYEELRRRHEGPAESEQVRIRHILVLSEKDGQEVMARLAAGEEFEDVAKDISKEPGTRRLGGLIEWFPRGTLPADLEDVAFALDVGETSELFKTGSGYHVILVLGCEVRPVRQELLNSYHRRNFEQWFAEQKAKADIQRYVTFLPPTPAP